MDEAVIHDDLVCWWCGVGLGWINLAVDPSIERLQAKDQERVRRRTCALCRLRAWSMMEEVDGPAGPNN